MIRTPSFIIDVAGIIDVVAVVIMVIDRPSSPQGPPLLERCGPGDCRVSLSPDGELQVFVSRVTQLHFSASLNDPRFTLGKRTCESWNNSYTMKFS